MPVLLTLPKMAAQIVGELMAINDKLFNRNFLKFDLSRPLYEQIIAAVKKAVARGDLGPGERIPSQRELARKLQVNPNTVQRAYREMEYGGLVTTVRGMGTFITTDQSLLRGIRRRLAVEAWERFLNELRDLGFTDQDVLTMVTQELSGASNGTGKDDGRNSNDE